MVRFAEENKNCLQSSEIQSPKRNCAKTVDEQLITDDAVLFLKSQTEQETVKRVEETTEEGESGTNYFFFEFSISKLFYKWIFS